MKKIPLVLASLVCTANVFAGDKDKEKSCCPKESEGCCSAELANGRMGCTLQMDRPNVDLCHGLELGVSALYWKPYIDGTEYAYTASGTAGDTVALPITGKLEIPKTSMSWGFKVSAGYFFCQDGWDLDAEFTFHRGSGSDKFSNTGGNWNQYIVPTTATTGLNIVGDAMDSFSGASSKVHTDFYRLGLGLSRGSYVSRLLSITPGFALTSTWLKIDQDSTFSDSSHANYYEDKESKAWQIGPTARLDTELHFGRSGFSFISESDMTLGFGNTKVSQKCQYATSPATNYTSISNNSITFAPNAHVLLGVQYERQYFEDTQHLKIMAGLDTFVMWDGNRTIRAINTVPMQFEQENGNLFALVGLTVTLNYQF